MRCHFVWDEVSKQKILIPGCWGSIHEEDMRSCTCYKGPTTAAGFEKQAYNEKVKELKDENDYLHKENKQLLRIIEKLSKAKK